MSYVPLADQAQELHHPQSWVTRYVWSQDHKVIAIQYGGTAILVGIVALVLSLLMRMQLGFPDSFDLIDDVWVTDPRYAIPVAIALRQSLIELAAARQAGEGQQTKMELVYQYLTGPRFRHRSQAIVEKFTDMQQDLDKERKTMTRLWAKREEQIRGVIESTAGMYGDLQGIAGRTLQEIEGLDIKLLPDSQDS